VADVEYNPYAYEIHEDPYPTYAALRAHAPVYRNEELDFWALSRHADVLAAFKDTERFSNDHGVSLDPESWGRRRRAARRSSRSTRRATRGCARWSRRASRRARRRAGAADPRDVVDYLDPLVGAGRFDFIDELAGKVPMDVISEMLGVPRADRAELRRRADLLVTPRRGPQRPAARGRRGVRVDPQLFPRRWSPSAARARRRPALGAARGRARRRAARGDRDSSRSRI
jgi:cytochrome P450